MSETSTYETIRLEPAVDGVATLYLDRPEKLNALTTLMVEEMCDAIDRTDGDDEVGAVVVTGSGRAFCAGADLAEGGAIFDHGVEPFSMERNPDGGGVLARRFFDSAKPLIAAINGPAVGIGATMTLPMDVRMAADDARIGFVFARRGLVPEASSSFFLPRIVGISQAAEWVYTGRIFDAAEAERAGLVRSLHPKEELLGAALALGAEMAASSSRVAVALARRMLWQMLTGAGNPVLAHEIDSEALHTMGTSDDMREGVAAFLEKREANYPMRVSADMPDFFARWGTERGAFGGLDSTSGGGS
ncbi:MAG TPA: enoyl-CoA hydratase-related protein [Solirubrobacterales bacterium]|jgi:enoyl-CoA hydratase/carnithine racemase|nr:enoyl-CoA hydratase-related protein [Solirubrobacterales bacterium]